jgi:hypothetical protein
VAVAKNDIDEQRAWIRQQFRLWMGRGFASTEERDLHHLYLVEHGADQFLANLMDSAEGQAFHISRGW